MSGTKEGGIRAYYSNIKQNPQHYSEIGRIGGQKSHTGGFYGDSERASAMGKLGGSISRRKPGTYGRRSSLEPKSCSFCHETGHAAYVCPVRADIKLRKEIAAAKYKVDKEKAEMNRDRMKNLAMKWAKR